MSVSALKSRRPRSYVVKTMVSVIQLQSGYAARPVGEQDRFGGRVGDVQRCDDRAVGAIGFGTGESAELEHDRRAVG